MVSKKWALTTSWKALNQGDVCFLGFQAEWLNGGAEDHGASSEGWEDGGGGLWHHYNHSCECFNRERRTRFTIRKRTRDVQDSRRDRTVVFIQVDSDWLRGRGGVAVRGSQSGSLRFCSREANSTFTSNGIYRNDQFLIDSACWWRKWLRFVSSQPTHRFTLKPGALTPEAPPEWTIPSWAKTQIL